MYRKGLVHLRQKGQPRTFIVLFWWIRWGGPSSLSILVPSFQVHSGFSQICSASFGEPCPIILNLMDLHLVSLNSCVKPQTLQLHMPGCSWLAGAHLCLSSRTDSWRYTYLEPRAESSCQLRSGCLRQLHPRRPAIDSENWSPMAFLSINQVLRNTPLPFLY